MLAEPKAVLTEAGMALPAEVAVEVHEHRATELHFILPPPRAFEGVDTSTVDPVVGKVTVQACEDAAFRQRLLADPKPAIAEVVGAEPPGSVAIHIHEVTPERVHFILPENPNAEASGELSDADLDAVAGGKGVGQFFSELGQATANRLVGISANIPGVVQWGWKPFNPNKTEYFDV